MINSREGIRDFILDIEHRFPVDEWEIDGLYVWPMIRFRLFFYLMKKTEYEVTDKKFSQNISVKKNKSLFLEVRRKLGITALMYRSIKWLRQLPTKKYLFIGHNHYRVNYKGKKFNRFFDVLIQDYNIKADSFYFEPRKGIDNLYNSEIVTDFSIPLEGFLKFRKLFKKANFKLECKGYEEYLSFLKSYEFSSGFAPLYSVEKLENWYNLKFRNKILFFIKALKRISPKQIMILCYYSENNMALTYAANKLNIKTIEMQHGPQTDVHMCYGNWSKISESGFGMLPRHYWCWDNSSKNTIHKWASKSKLYSVITIGNPWVNYWKNKAQEYNYNGFILYSLQPKPLTFEMLFPKQLVSMIRSGNLTWFIRLHPRQLKNLKKISSFLKKKNLDDKINIIDASNDPLPQLLSKAILHVTNFSGTTIEATLMNKKTILLHKNGKHSFQEFIDSGEAFYLDPNSKEFKNEFKTVLKNLKRKKNSGVNISLPNLFA